MKGLQPGQYTSDYLDGALKIKAHLVETDAKKLQEITKIIREEGIVFMLPPNGVLTDRHFTLPLEVTKPPYPVTILEFEVTYEEEETLSDPIRSYRRIVAAIDHGDGVLVVPILHTESRKWHPPFVGVFMSYGELFLSGEGEVVTTTEDERVQLRATIVELLPDMYKKALAIHKIIAPRETPEEAAKGLIISARKEINAYFDFCKVLHDNEVTITEVVPDASANQMRRARGKTKLFTYKVLTIGGLKKHSKHAGGTHASPRSHLRRGYYRNYKSGKRAWVNACMIKGNGEGFVHKDYNVLGQEGASTQ